jgi:hypothetical protein
VPIVGSVFAFGYAEAGGSKKLALPNIPKMNSALERNARSPCYAAGKILFPEVGFSKQDVV